MNCLKLNATLLEIAIFVAQHAGCHSHGVIRETEFVQKRLLVRRQVAHLRRRTLTIFPLVPFLILLLIKPASLISTLIVPLQNVGEGGNQLVLRLAESYVHRQWQARITVIRILIAPHR